MYKEIIDLLVCPQCLPLESPLSGKIRSEDRGDIINGTLSCNKCGAEYPIENGIAFLLPVDFSTSFSNNFKYEDPLVLSSYLWSHYADLSGDPDATGAYNQWPELIDPLKGIAIDAGCAVGRLAFELAKKSDFVIGVDASSSFIKRAREIKLQRKTQFTIKTEGMLEEVMEVSLPKAIPADNVEFILADIQCLPFRSSCFSTAMSLNIIDKIPSPLAHLKELNRTARQKGAQLLFSDPFSWSTEITEPKNWLGGTLGGRFQGSGIDNIRALLCGMPEQISPPWEITAHGHVWWKIRNHRNHFELIRSLYLKAVR